jgi:hypothetical protein
MNMENILLYEDEEQKIEIAGWFDYWLNYIHVSQIKLSEKFLERMIPLVYAKLSAAGVEIKSPDKAYCGKAPIFTYGTAVNFVEPFTVFNDVQEYFSIYPVLRDNLDAIRESIEIYNSMEMPEGTAIYYQIFERPYQDIDGWLAYTSKEKIIIMFWGYKEPSKDFN